MLNDLIKRYPLLIDIASAKEVFWFNPEYTNFNEGISCVPFSKEDVEDAYLRFKRFIPYLKSVFPEINKGIVDSPLVEIPNMKRQLEKHYNFNIRGKLLLKCDNNLPISGSIKARGGIYEVLKYAEKLAIEHELLTINSNYEIINSDKFRKFFSRYKISVASTGNLGLSVGIIGSKLGFKVLVHMTKDAKIWKKKLLNDIGVTIIEYESNYSDVVNKAREIASNDSNLYFIDDEKSSDLFLGYAIGAYNIKKQLTKMNIKVDENHPLHVYLPCGVGGAPGGITFGLKLLFKDNVHCYFAEPTHSPCMLIGLITNLHNKINVQDLGLDNKTIADGLAVDCASSFVGQILKKLIRGVYTVSDQKLLKLLNDIYKYENIKLEPSSLAGLPGVLTENYLNSSKKITHICWATGGGMLPKDEFAKYLI